MAGDGESPYTIPLVLLCAGILFGVLALALGATDEGPPDFVVFALAGVGGLFAWIGGTATAFVLGTDHLRRR